MFIHSGVVFAVRVSPGFAFLKQHTEAAPAPATALRSQRGQTAGVCFNRDGKQSDERRTGRTHSGVAQMIFLGSSSTGHVVFPGNHFLSFDRRQT